MGINLNFPHFQEYPELVYGFSMREDGSMHRHLEKENRAAYFMRLGIDPSRVVTADLVHGTNVVYADAEMAGTMIPDTDGLITTAENLFLTITAADCFPLYLYDPNSRAVGIVHLGWRGIVGGIIKNITAKMAPGKLLVGISPGIRACHFEIKQDILDNFKDYTSFVEKRDGNIFVDLPGIIRQQLVTNGVSNTNIEDSGLCTFCLEQEYFSYRRDKPPEIQVMVAYIGRKT